MAEYLNRIHCLDCIEGLQKLPAESVHLAFADPPFNIGYEYDVYKDNKSYHEYLDWTRAWMSAVRRVLTPNGTFWVAIGDEYAAEIKLIAQNDLKLTCRSWVIWYYTFGVNCTKKFTRSHAHLFHFVVNPRDFTFNEDEICVPSARQLVYADSRAVPSGRLPDDTWILRPQDVPDGFRPTQSTWYFSRVAGTFKERAGFHGCQMPEQLLGRIIRTSSKPGAIVLDPFAGSGTTLAVAKKLGRKWIGFELSKEYCEKASMRVESARVGQPLVGAPEPVMSAPKTPGLASKLWLRSAVERALIEAFAAARSKELWSSDRVIADPQLNESFCDECREFGLPGTAPDWNRALLALRKAGKLKHLPKSQRTTFPDEVVDQFIFASEIAMGQVARDSGLSADEILCTPALAEELDNIARKWAPGFTSLHYRWGAFMLRKRAHDVREWSRKLSKSLRRRQFSKFTATKDLHYDGLHEQPGIYLTRRANDWLYVGETVDLARRLRLHLQYADWQEDDDLMVGLLPLGEQHAKEDRWGLQAHFISEYEPILNYCDLANA